MKTSKWWGSLFGLGLLPHVARAEWKTLVRRLPALGPTVSFLKDSFANDTAGSLPITRATLASQKWAGLPIEGAWTKQLLDQSGRLQSTIEHSWSGEASAALQEKIAQARACRPSLASLLPPGEKPAVEWPLELVLVEHDGQLEPTWSYAYIPSTEDTAIERRVRVCDGAPETRNVAHNIDSQPASAFAQSPLAGPVQEVVLRDLDGGETLSTAKYMVTTAKPEHAEAGENGFHYDLNDPRFDQVQVFYYVQQYLQHLGKLGLEAVTPLQIKVQVGEHSNMAFYYRGSIRLGSGDDVRFHERLRDPTVVLHEVTHAVIDRVARLPADGVGGALNEAFADYFAASYLADPRIGLSSSLSGTPVRDLSTAGPLPAHPADAPVYDLAQTVAGTFWDLRVSMGAETADALIAQALLALGPSSLLVDLRDALLNAAERSLSLPRQIDVGTLLDRHAWPRRGELVP